ncbi:MAG: deoxyribonuclease IV [Planctomycetaceae bacterium]|nr:deoxyribonuclease IV [Planctomycetaceae bacterium]
MNLFGAHFSISGGLEQAVLAAAELGFDCVQLFSKNSNQWKGKPITPEAAVLFQTTLRETKITHPLIHDSYLINLGSAKPDLYEKSLAAFSGELLRAEQLGVPYVVMHPGTPTGDTTDDPVKSGLRRIASAIDQSLESVSQTGVLLETTAGQGANLGWKFEHLAKILELSKYPGRLGVCVDTCHIHAAGYPITDQKSYEKTFDLFDRIVGLDRLKAFHLNDSVKELGSRVDRHAHLGHGTLGLEPFRLLVNDGRFQKIPMYLETPKGTTEIDGQTVDWDLVNLQTLRKLNEK